MAASNVIHTTPTVEALGLTSRFYVVLSKEGPNAWYCTIILDAGDATYDEKTFRGSRGDVRARATAEADRMYREMLEIVAEAGRMTVETVNGT